MATLCWSAEMSKYVTVTEACQIVKIVQYSGHGKLKWDMAYYEMIKLGIEGDKKTDKNSDFITSKCMKQVYFDCKISSKAQN
jgi:hypothetical protein